MMGLKAKLKNESGVILMASTMGVFIMLSLFAFYLARFSVVETRTGGYHTQDIKARNLAMTSHCEITSLNILSMVAPCSRFYYRKPCKIKSKQA